MGQFYSRHKHDPLWHSLCVWFWIIKHVSEFDTTSGINGQYASHVYEIVLYSRHLGFRRFTSTSWNPKLQVWWGIFGAIETMVDWHASGWNSRKWRIWSEFSKNHDCHAYDLRRIFLQRRSHFLQGLPDIWLHQCGTASATNSNHCHWYLMDDDYHSTQCNAEEIDYLFEGNQWNYPNHTDVKSNNGYFLKRIFKYCVLYYVCKVNMMCSVLCQKITYCLLHHKQIKRILPSVSHLNAKHDKLNTTTHSNRCSYLCSVWTFRLMDFCNGNGWTRKRRTHLFRKMWLKSDDGAKIKGYRFSVKSLYYMPSIYVNCYVLLILEGK